MNSTSHAAAPPARDVYQELGVKPLINAAGTYTALTGSLMPVEVVEAIASAARRFVHLGELQTIVGKKIAERIGCEAALVTAGAVSGVGRCGVPSAGESADGAIAGKRSVDSSRSRDASTRQAPP